MKWFRWFFYTIAALDYGMGQYARWVEHSRPEAGYWIACASLYFLIGYVLFDKHEPQEGSGK